MLKTIIATIFFLTFLTTGCGNAALRTAHSTVVVLGQTWTEADATFAPMYELARIAARDTSNSWTDRDKKLEKWEKARAALTAAGLAIKTAALAISIAEDGFTSDWTIQIGRAIDAVTATCEALKVVGIVPPEAFIEALK